MARPHNKDTKAMWKKISFMVFNLFRMIWEISRLGLGSPPDLPRLRINILRRKQWIRCWCCEFNRFNGHFVLHHYQPLLFGGNRQLSIIVKYLHVHNQKCRCSVFCSVRYCFKKYPSLKNMDEFCRFRTTKRWSSKPPFCFFCGVTERPHHDIYSDYYIRLLYIIWDFYQRSWLSQISRKLARVILNTEK